MAQKGEEQVGSFVDKIRRIIGKNTTDYRDFSPLADFVYDMRDETWNNFRRWLFSVCILELDMELMELRINEYGAQYPLVNIILVSGRSNDRNVQCIVNSRFGDRIWTYLYIKIKVSDHIRYFVGPNDIHVRSKSRPKIVILH